MVHLPLEAKRLAVMSKVDDEEIFMAGQTERTTEALLTEGKDGMR